MTAVFVTATGTEIGKTFVAAGLIRHWRAAGIEVDALKPVVTGFDPAAALPSDPGVLLAALGRPVTPSEIDRIAPWRYAAPLAPDMAARRENRSVGFSALLDYCRKGIAAYAGTLLIEGIGGIMVPLDDRHTVLDWMADLRLPLVVVTGTYLGAISHTLTALDVLARRKLEVKALIVNETPGSTVTMQNTVDTLTNFVGPVPLLGLRRVQAPVTGDAVFKEIAALL